MEQSSFERYLGSCACGEAPREVMQLGADEPDTPDTPDAPNTPNAPDAPEQRALSFAQEPLPTLGCIRQTGGCARCVEVCPNGANIVLEFGSGSREILHLADKCLSCGSCRGACPFDGDPAADKFTLYSNEALYTASRSAGFLPVGEGRYIVRYGCMQKGFIIGAEECEIPLEYATLIEAAARQLEL